MIEPSMRARRQVVSVRMPTKHLAKVVVDAHGASIRAMSDGIGRGSTFVLRLPYRPAATPEDGGDIAAVAQAARFRSAGPARAGLL